MLQALLGPLGTIVGSWAASRNKVREAKAEAQVARLQNGIPGYSDEVLIFIWSAPFIMSFIPPLQPYTTLGFQTLGTLPDWYVGGFVAITGSVFGIDKLLMWQGPKGP